MSIAELIIHNEHEEYDSTLLSGSADIRIGEASDTIASMAPVILDATVQQVSRTDNEISVAVLDGQNRGNTKQQRIFDTSGEGFGVLLPEIWGKSNRFLMINMDDDEKVYGCAGPLVSIDAVYVGSERQTGGHTISISGSTATVTFAASIDASVFIDGAGLGGTLPGAMLYGLLTRVSTVCQGSMVAWSANTMIVDSRIDDVAGPVIGKLITKMTPAGFGAQTITAFDPVTRMVTVGLPWLVDPVIGTDLYSIDVNTRAGGFTPSQVDSTGFDALDIALPYEFGLVASNGENAIEMQDQMLGPLLCHMGPRRDGIVQLKRLTPAAGPAVENITRIIGEIYRDPRPIYWSVEARYRKDNTGGHWRSVTAFDATIKSLHPEAKTHVIDVPVQDREGAELIAQHWLTCFGHPTELATMTVDHDLSGLELGDVVNVVDDRYQFKGGKLATVVSMTDNFNEHDELIIWVDMQ
jgi:hypothetical protein